MKGVSGKFWKENLDKKVKAHQKLLTKQDQVVNEMKVLRDKEARLSGEDSKKAKKELEEITKEIEEVQKELDGIREEEKKLWTLTSKVERAAAA